MLQSGPVSGSDCRFFPFQEDKFAKKEDKIPEIPHFPVGKNGTRTDANLRQKRQVGQVWDVPAVKGTGCRGVPQSRGNARTRSKGGRGETYRKNWLAPPSMVAAISLVGLLDSHQIKHQDNI